MELAVPFRSFRVLEHYVWTNKKHLFPQMNTDRKANWPCPKDRAIPRDIQKDQRPIGPHWDHGKFVTSFTSSRGTAWNVWFFLTFKNHKINPKYRGPPGTYNATSADESERRAGVLPAQGEFGLHFVLLT